MPKEEPMTESPAPISNASAPAAPTPDAASFPLTIDEFCARLSGHDRRVELIGAFAAHEKAAGRPKDHERAYMDRYAEFAALPA